ncbi:MAG: hypothetical protein ACREQJ_18815 [Candidatus Binatia bacterium]
MIEDGFSITPLPESLRARIEAVLHGPGELPPRTRQAAEMRAAILGGRDGEGAALVPEPVERYVEKIAKHAYKTTDEDIDALKQAGYSENAIFEITVSAALGAGIARWQRGLMALKGDGR